MSRIGRAPIALPAGVTFDNTDNLITVKGPLGTLTQKVDSSIDVVLEDGHILVKRHSDDKDHRALHGLYRALIHNMVTGVTKGFEKNLVVAGVGYKVTATANKLTMRRPSRRSSPSSPITATASTTRTRSSSARKARPPVNKR